MSKLSTAGAAVQAFLALDATFYLAALAISAGNALGLDLPTDIATNASMMAGLARAPVGVAWLVWIYGFSERAQRMDGRLPPAWMALLAYILPLVRHLAPAVVAWAQAAHLRPRARWLVLLWLPVWKCSALAGYHGDPSLDLVLLPLGLLACGLAGLLVRELEEGLAERLAGDSLGG